MKNLPFVLGTDIFHIPRLDPINKSSFFVQIAKRVLHPREIPISTRLPIAGGLDRPLHEWLTVTLSEAEQQKASENLPADIAAASNAARFLAGRWAAKEAARKAWGASLLSWKDVTVRIDYDVPSTEGTTKPVKIVCQPHVNLGEDFGESKNKLRLKQEGRLSISHDGDYCVATVIAEPLNKDILSVFQNRASLIAKRKAQGWKKSKVVTMDDTDDDDEEEFVQQKVDDHETSRDETK